MKKILASFALIGLIILATPAGVTALYPGSDAKLAQASGPVEVAEIDTSVNEQHSGYVDDNGDPISIEEFNKMRNESSKNLLERNPFLAMVIIVGVLSAIGVVTYKIFKK